MHPYPRSAWARTGWPLRGPVTLTVRLFHRPQRAEALPAGETFSWPKNVSQPKRQGVAKLAADCASGFFRRARNVYGATHCIDIYGSLLKIAAAQA